MDERFALVHSHVLTNLVMAIKLQFQLAKVDAPERGLDE